jgi:hypothetical protein
MPNTTAGSLLFLAPLVSLALNACRESHPATDEDEGSSDESSGDPGEPTPGAPDENCPGPLDPARVYVVATTGEVQSGIGLIFPVDAPDQVCAYQFAEGRDHFVGVDGGLRGITWSDGGSVIELPQRWLRIRETTKWYLEHGGESLEVAALGCPIGAKGSFDTRQRIDGDVGFLCADGIGGEWVYDRPMDDTPIDVAASGGALLVAPLPLDRWLIVGSSDDGIGLAVLQGDGQRIDVVADTDIVAIGSIGARMTESGALVAGFGRRTDGSTTVELYELLGEQLTSIAVYEHGSDIAWFDTTPGNAVLQTALGADGTLAAVVEAVVELELTRRAVWLRPNTLPVIAAEGDGDDPAHPGDEVFTVISQ